MHEWQTDTLAAAAANAQIEGDDASGTAIVATSCLTNYTQILRKVFAITDTEDTVDKAGRASEISYQTQNKLKELARDIEYALVVNITTATGHTGLGRQMKGLSGWIVTNTASGANTATDLTTAILNTALGLAWAQGAKPQHLLCGSYVKLIIDAFTGNTRNINADLSKINAAVNVYESSFGTLQIHLHQQINATYPTSVMILGDMSLWQKAWLRKVKSEKLARTGSATKIMIEGELTLECRQEKGSAAVVAIKGV